MILLNFSHPLSTAQFEATRGLAGGQAMEERRVPAQADPDAPFAPQATALADAAGLTVEEWQTEAILIHAPSYSFLAAALLAELHGRMGYFPPILRLKPAAGAIPPRFEVAEILNLQAIRDAARAHRRTS